MVHEDVTEPGIPNLVGDSMLKRKRGSKHPVGHKTRLSQYYPDVFGFRIVELIAQGDAYQIPVDFAIVQCTDNPDYQPENALFRQMLQDFQHPAWCQELVVTADATYASRANLATIQALGYGYVMAPPRTWKFASGKAVKDLVTYLPRGKYTEIRIPTVNTQRHQTFWIDAKRVQLHHLGDVAVVLSICGCTDGPKQTKILVTNLPETVRPREIVGVYLCWWWLELLVKELKGVVGAGQHQVTKHVDWVERSVAVAIKASLFLLKMRAKDITPDRPGSAFHPQRAFAWEVVQAQSEHSSRQMARVWLQMGKAACGHTAILCTAG
jgi:hypothetical protein